MPGFAHLCPECLDVPTAQCGYRGCPQRAQPTASALPVRPGHVAVAPLHTDQATAAQLAVRPTVAPSAYRDGAPMADATRAVTLPAGLLPAAVKEGLPAGTAAYGSLTGVADALATRFVDPAALPKTNAMPIPAVPEPPPRRPPPAGAGHGENNP